MKKLYIFIVAMVVAFVATMATPLTYIRVEGTSMTPTLKNQDWLVVRETSNISLNDIVVFKIPNAPKLNYHNVSVKRVVAMEGDTIEIKDKVLYVNDVLVDEPHVEQPAVDGMYFGPVRVKMNHVFVLGDNRQGSVDSIHYGAIPFSNIIGKVIFINKEKQ